MEMLDASICGVGGKNWIVYREIRLLLEEADTMIQPRTQGTEI